MVPETACIDVCFLLYLNQSSPYNSLVVPSDRVHNCTERELAPRRDKGIEYFCGMTEKTMKILFRVVSIGIEILARGICVY
jgi:hypothetical protein